jgi:hypothetical protein
MPSELRDSYSKIPAVGLDRHQAQDMAQSFRRQAADARVLADRIEQAKE